MYTQYWSTQELLSDTVVEAEFFLRRYAAIFLSKRVDFFPIAADVLLVSKSTLHVRARSWLLRL